MPKQNTTEQTPKARKTAEDYAREAAADNPATRSTPDKPRPVSVTSTDESRAREGLQVYEVEVQRADGHRSVRRVTAASQDDPIVWAAVDGHDVIRVDEVRAA